MLYFDLKLENVLLSAEGDAVLVDFGFARCGIDVAGGQTVRRPGGTRVYTPPEGILGRPVGAACDWWALGILLYELIVGYGPFAEHASDERSLRLAITNGRVRFPREAVAAEAELEGDNNGGGGGGGGGGG